MVPRGSPQKPWTYHWMEGEKRPNAPFLALFMKCAAIGSWSFVWICIIFILYTVLYTFQPSCRPNDGRQSLQKPNFWEAAWIKICSGRTLACSYKYGHGLHQKQTWYLKKKVNRVQSQFEWKFAKQISWSNSIFLVHNACLGRSCHFKACESSGRSTAGFNFVALDRAALPSRNSRGAGEYLAPKGRHYFLLLLGQKRLTSQTWFPSNASPQLFYFVLQRNNEETATTSNKQHRTNNTQQRTNNT